MKAADGSDVDRRKAIREFVDAWTTDIVVHFDDEERLLPELLDEEANRRLMQEHEHLRKLAAEADERRHQVDPEADWVRRLGQTLNDHIRWEERELFMAVQEQADDEQLAALETQTQEIERTRPRTRRR